MKEEDWLNPPHMDQTALFNGNSVLRGQTLLASIEDNIIIN